MIGQVQQPNILNLGNILSTASSIKTARLAREHAKKADARADKASARAERNALNKEARAKENQAFKREDRARREEERLVGQKNLENYLRSGESGLKLSEEEIQGYSKDPKVFKMRYQKMLSDQLLQRRTDANKILLQKTMPNASPAEIEKIAQLKTSNLGRFIKTFTRARGRQKKAMLQRASEQARKLFMVTQSPNPQQAYTAYRDSLPDPSSVPAIYDPNQVAIQLAENADVFKTAQKFMLEEKKHTNKLNESSTRYENRISELDKKAELKKDKPMVDNAEKVADSSNANKWREEMLKKINEL